MIQGKYKIGKRINFSTDIDCFLASDPKGNRFVLKKSKNSAGETPIFHEFMVLEKLKDNPFVPSVKLSRIFHERNPFILIEYFDYPSLEKKLAENPALADRLKTLRKMAEAVKSIHESGILHLDLTLKHFLVGPGDEIKIIDFGNADDAAKPFSQRMAKNPQFSAPEQCLGRPASKKMDVYAFGIILFQYLTGRYPKVDDLPSRINRQLPSTVDRIYLKASAENPEKRYRDFGQMLKDFEALNLNGL